MADRGRVAYSKQCIILQPVCPQDAERIRRGGAFAYDIVHMGRKGSGVQRLLDARGQRSSWMPSKIFCIPFVKFLTTFFSRSPKFFTFFASCQISREFAPPWMPSQCCIMPQ